MQSTLQLPRHLAVIMDGNGRWAARRGRPRWDGHRAGARAVRRLIEAAAHRGIAQLTLYAFSADNWQRPRVEVDAILALCAERLESEAKALADAGIRTTAIGRRDRLPAGLLRAIERAESITAKARRMQLRIALDYSSRDSIAHALLDAPSAAQASQKAQGVAGGILPPVDLLMRTGGERRLSDFLLWECAYAELAFLDVLFPDLTARDLDVVLADFAGRERRFGGVPLQKGA
jgi:undecaprenyl diphosphate synthase